MNQAVREGTFLPGRPAAHGSLVDLLLAAEAENPDRTHFRWPGGGHMTVGRLADRARRWASVLAEHGVGRGDRVALVCGNSTDFVALQFATYMRGAVEVPVNAELRGTLMRRILADADPTLIVVDEAIADAVAGHEPPGAIKLLLDERLGTQVAATEPLADPVRPGVSDLAFILYTSGTTGPSKGVMLQHGYLPNMAATWISATGLADGDGVYFPAPFFHVDAHVMNAICLMTGATFGFAQRFSVGRFWAEAADVGATVLLAVGSMASALVAKRERQAPDHRFRLGVVAPIMPEVFAYFEDELGIPLLQLYGQTEADGVVFNTLDRRRRGAAGWACCGFDIQIVDDEDNPVAIGEIGRLVYRPREPRLMTIGYWRRDEATVAATRNLWWHTGDLGRIDADGFFWFEGRASDSLRRRGENISAWELESALRGAPGVDVAVAIPVPDEIGGEDEIKVFLVLEADFDWDARAFFAYCAEQLPRFAQPRFVELIAEQDLVRGAGTGAVQKHLLAVENGEHTIDRLDILR